MTQQEARARVRRGAALLDEKRPGWWNHIAVNGLEMAEGCRCVLGQLEGNFCDGVDRLLKSSLARARTHGFDIDVYDHTALAAFATLQAEWIAVIKARVNPEPDAPVVEWTHREPAKV